MREQTAMVEKASTREICARNNRERRRKFYAHFYSALKSHRWMPLVFADLDARKIVRMHNTKMKRNGEPSQ